MGSWDWNDKAGRDVLEGIVALLFALAGLAETAASLRGRHRREVLGILGAGEAAARVYFAGMTINALPGDGDFLGDDASTPPDPSGQFHDASHLAARFRALAFMLAALLTLHGLSALPTGEVTSSPLARTDGRRRGRRPRPLHHASRGPPPRKKDSALQPAATA